MEYNFRFHDSDLRNDIKSLLEEQLKKEAELMFLPPLIPEEIDTYVAQAIEDIKQQGNSALYHGLVLNGTEIALKKIRESYIKPEPHPCHGCILPLNHRP